MAADWYLPLALIKTCDFCLKGIDRGLKKEKAIKPKSEEGALESLAWLVALLEIKGEVNVEAFGLELVISWDSKESVELTLFLQDELNRFVRSFYRIVSASVLTAEQQRPGWDGRGCWDPSPFVWPSSEIKCYPLSIQRVPLQP